MPSLRIKLRTHVLQCSPMLGMGHFCKAFLLSQSQSTFNECSEHNQGAWLSMADSWERHWRHAYDAVHRKGSNFLGGRSLFQVI